jgi:hypothetical protein
MAARLEESPAGARQVMATAPAHRAGLAWPRLPVAWAAWCAAAVVLAPRSRGRHLAWFYPAATALAVLASANHFLLDAVGGLAITGLGVLATSRPSWWRALTAGHGWWLAAGGYTAIACCVSPSPWAKPPAPATVHGSHSVRGQA